MRQRLLQVTPSKCISVYVLLLKFTEIPPRFVLECSSEVSEKKALKICIKTSSWVPSEILTKISTGIFS